MNINGKDIKGLGVGADQLCSYLQTNIKVIRDSIYNGEIPSKCLYDEYVLLSSLLECTNPIIPSYLVYDKFELARQLNGRIYEDCVEVDAVYPVGSIALKVDSTYLIQSIRSRVTGWISNSEIEKRYNNSWLDVLAYCTFRNEKAQNSLKKFVVFSILTGHYELDEGLSILVINLSSYSNKMREALIQIYKELLNSSKFKIQQVDGFLKFPVSYLFNE